VMMNRIPELEDLARDPSDYDLVIVGTPVWSWSPSPPVKAFMRKADLDGSMVALFCTHEGGPGKTLQKMKEDLDGRVVGERGFFAPLKKDREKTLTEAISWAREMVSVSSSREIR
ncbi:MAG: flavodoxin domain-containing protein, partial [Deltaproteobacteria bacterium]